MASIAAMFRHAKINSLNCVVVQAQEEMTPDLVVILCHGFGAPGDDLVPLGSELLRRPALAQRVRFIFPAAPLSLDEFGFQDARAWWQIEPERLMALQTGDTSKFARMHTETPEGLPQARRALLGLIDEVCRQTGLAMKNIVLGGFSQGAMLTTDVTLRLEEAPAGLCILSGALISADEWKARAARRQSLPVFQGHGRQDGILPYSTGEALRDLLVNAQLDVDFFPFDGAHTITGPELSRMATFLEARLTAITASKS